MNDIETIKALLEIQASFRKFNKMLDKIEANAKKAIGGGSSNIKPDWDV